MEGICNPRHLRTPTVGGYLQSARWRGFAIPDTPYLPPLEGICNPHVGGDLQSPTPLKTPFVDRGLLKSSVGFIECYGEMGWGGLAFLPPERKACGGSDQHSTLNVPCLMLNDTVVCGKRHLRSSQAMRPSDAIDGLVCVKRHARLPQMTKRTIKIKHYALCIKH